MKQGKSTDGDAVPPTETALEFAARVEAHHASLSAEYTATQAMRVYLDGLTDQSLADIVRTRAGLAERKHQTVRAVATEIEQLLVNRAEDQYMQSLRAATPAEAKADAKLPKPVRSSDPARHPTAPCHLHPTQKHTNAECYQQHPELRKSARRATTAVATVTSSADAKFDKLCHLVEAMLTAQVQKTAEPTRPAPRYSTGQPSKPAMQQSTLPDCPTCHKSHRPDDCYVEDPTRAQPGWRPGYHCLCGYAYPAGRGAAR